VVIQHTAHSATMRAFLVWPSAAVDRKSASSVNSPNTADSTNSVAPHPFHRSACPSRVHQKGTKDAFGLRDHECHHWRNRTQMETRASKQRWSSPCALRSRRQMTFIDSQMSWWRFRETFGDARLQSPQTQPAKSCVRETGRIIPSAEPELYLIGWFLWTVPAGSCREAADTRGPEV
jgi:hypothetical protein